MSFNRPDLSTLRQRIAADIERHSGQSASKRGDTYYPLSQAIAGVAHGLHGHLVYNADQIFDDTADEANLQRRAAEMNIPRINPARASGTATINGRSGAIVPVNTLLQTDTQQVYRVTKTATLEAGTAILELTSVEVGGLQNIQPGTTLRLISSLLDVDTTAAIIEMAGGADIEPISRLEQRLSERRKNPPMGGNDQDYIAWAKASHTDITRAWCYRNALGLGTVVVRFVTDELASPIPSQAHVDAVVTYTDQHRPAGMKRFEVYAPTPKPLDLAFTRLTPNTAAAKAAIEAELKDLLRRVAEPGGTLLLSQINEAISIATGETDHRITLADDFTCEPGEYPVLGVITWP